MMVITNAITQSKAKFHKSHHLHQRINVTHDDGADDDDNDDGDELMITFFKWLNDEIVLISIRSH